MTLGYLDPTVTEVTSFSSGSGEAMAAYLATRELAVDAEFNSSVTQMWAAVTDRRMILGRTKGVLRLIPSELLIDAPIEQSSVEWWDESRPGPDRRLQLMFFGSQWGAEAQRRLSLSLAFVCA